MKIINCHHVCIQTENYKESINFYKNILGFEVVHVNKGFHTREYNTWLIGGGILIELQTPKKGTSFLKWSNLNCGPVHLAFVVEDVKIAYKELKNIGYSNFKIKNGNELYKVKDTFIFKVIAPEGTEIEIRENQNID